MIRYYYWLSLLYSCSILNGSILTIHIYVLNSVVLLKFETTERWNPTGNDIFGHLETFFSTDNKCEKMWLFEKVKIGGTKCIEI